jgi:uncharacterized protein (DUF4415 family)
MKPDPTNWRRVDALTDAEIKRAVEADADAAPILDSDWFAKARVSMPPTKELISIRIDKDLLDYFRELGPGYQTRINAVLRAFVEHESALRAAGGSAQLRVAARNPSSLKRAASPEAGGSGRAGRKSKRQ